MIQGRIPEIDKHPKNKRNKSQSISGQLDNWTDGHYLCARPRRLSSILRMSREYHNFLLYNFFL